jgi:hypothetical protein
MATVLVNAGFAYAIEYSALSNEFTLDTRDRIPAQHFALSNIFTLDTLDFSRNDLNRDGVINILDVVLLVENFGNTGANLAGDINGDSKVDNIDLDILVKHFGEKNQ